MANNRIDVETLGANVQFLGMIGAALSFLGIFVPWFHLGSIGSGVDISGLNLGAEDNTPYIIALALLVVLTSATLIVSHRRQNVYVALLSQFFGLMTFMLFGFVLAHSASGMLSSGSEFQYYAVVSPYKYELGFFMIVAGQALSLVCGLSNLILSIVREVVRGNPG